jgi:hypothetical protein
MEICDGREFPRPDGFYKNPRVQKFPLVAFSCDAKRQPGSD